MSSVVVKGSTLAAVVPLGAACSSQVREKSSACGLFSSVDAMYDFAASPLLFIMQQPLGDYQRLAYTVGGARRNYMGTRIRYSGMGSRGPRVRPLWTSAGGWSRCTTITRAATTRGFRSRSCHEFDDRRLGLTVLALVGDAQQRDVHRTRRFDPDHLIDAESCPSGLPVLVPPIDGVRLDSPPDLLTVRKDVRWHLERGLLDQIDGRVKRSMIASIRAAPR
jgi:hypothetical protein